MGDEVPEDVRVFLSQYIDSYEQLELLLLLRREGSEWTAQDLCPRLKISLPLTEAALSALHSRGLLQSSVGPGAPYYRPMSRADGFDETMSRLASVYASQPIQIIRLMSANAIERVRTAALRTFVDAFVFRKDGRRG